MRTINVEQLKARMDAGEKLHVVDVREPYEHQEFNISEQLVPLGKITSMQADELDDLKDEEVILYCRSGKRSATAAMFLESMGFTNTVNLDGGMLAWQAAYGNRK